MINLKLELQNYQPIDLKSIKENTSDIPDNIKNSIILYNKALESLGSGSEDIAIIELKKAISMNPHFCEAMNLLGLCYSYIKDYPRAAEIFEKVAAAENNGVKALRYLNLLNAGGNPAPANTRDKKKAGLNMSKAKTSKKPGNGTPFFNNLKPGGRIDLIKYMAGIVIGALLVLLVRLPYVSGNNDNADLRVTADGDKKLMEEKIAAYESSYKELEEKYRNLQKDLEAAKSSVDYYKFSIKLFEVESMVSKKNYEGAADMLVLMKTVDFKGEEKARFERMYKEIMPAAATAVFEQGFKLFNAGQYQEALKKLNKVQVYDNNFERMDAVLYYAGKSYKELNDSRNAVAMFQRILDNYPESRYSKYAGFRVKELTELP